MNNRTLKIYLFYCSTSFDPVDLTGLNNGDESELKLIPLPCSGKLDILYLTKAFETGADGVAVVTCKQGECRYLEGNLRARKRAEAIEKLLDEVGLGRERIMFIQMSDGGIEQVSRAVDDFRKRIKALVGKTSDVSIRLS